jgi:hypothetical protein
MIRRGEGGCCGEGQERYGISLQGLYGRPVLGCDRVPPTCQQREQDAGDHKGPPLRSSPPSPLQNLMGFS